MEIFRKNLKVPQHFWMLSLKGTSGGGGGLVAKSCLTLKTPWNVAYQSPLSMRFFRQKYWSGLPFPPSKKGHLGFVDHDIAHFKGKKRFEER